MQPAEHAIREHEIRIARDRCVEKMHGLEEALLLGSLEFEFLGLHVECVGIKIGGGRACNGRFLDR